MAKKKPARKKVRRPARVAKRGKTPGRRPKAPDPLLDAVKVHTGKLGRPRKRLKVMATDKGYDAKVLRQQLRKRGIRAQIPKRVWKTKKNRGRPIKTVVPRFQAERTFAWFQKKYRRLVVRWERIAACFEAFLALATVHIWIHRLIVG